MLKYVRVLHHITFKKEAHYLFVPFSPCLEYYFSFAPSSFLMLVPHLICIVDGQRVCILHLAVVLVLIQAGPEYKVRNS
jgi:hypothetical protein